MINFGENIRSAWNGVWSNKLRSMLTMLGIIIGIAAVICITTLGNGLEGSVMDSMNTLGTNNVTFMVQAKHTGGSSQMDVSSYMTGSGTTMRQKDLVSDHMLAKLKDKFPSRIDEIGVSESAGSGKAVRSGTKKKGYISLIGVNHGYTYTQGLKFKAGRTITKKEIKDKTYSAVISSKLAKTLYGDNYAKVIGKKVKAVINNKSYTFKVVGVYKYEEAQQSQMTGQDFGLPDQSQSTQLFVPMSVGKEVSGADNGYSTFLVKTNKASQSAQFSKDAQKYLNDTFYKSNDDFHISSFSMDVMIQAVNSMLSKIELALALIAGISLLVGGIGVMNIMLVSVTERTREIGIRKAIGATNGEIRMQFAIESIFICLIGGLIGIILGAVMGNIGSAILHFHAVVSVKSVIVAVGVSFAIGIFFGLYPASRAAKLNPIDALRFE